MSIRIAPLPPRTALQPAQWPHFYAEKSRRFLAAHPLLVGLAKVALIIAGLATLAAATVYLRDDSARAANTTPSVSPPYEGGEKARTPSVSATVERGEILTPAKVVAPVAPVVVKPIAASGRVVANAEFDVRSRLNGQLARVAVEVGEDVKKGDVLAEIDPADELRCVKRAEVVLGASQARLAQARSTVAIAERNLSACRIRLEAALKSAAARAQRAQSKADRLKETVQMNFVSKDQYDAAEADAILTAADVDSSRALHEDVKTLELALELRKQDVRCAEAQIEIEQLTLAAAQQRLRDTRILAPADGVVLARCLEPGQTVIGGPGVVGTAVATLADFSRTFVLAAVDESSLSRIRAGQEATVALAAYPALPLRGKVVRVESKGRRVGDKVVFDVRVELLDAQRVLLRNEMTAQVTIAATAD